MTIQDDAPTIERTEPYKIDPDAPYGPMSRTIVERQDNGTEVVRVRLYHRHHRPL